jgi:hypothetical protein
VEICVIWLLCVVIDVAATVDTTSRNRESLSLMGMRTFVSTTLPASTQDSVSYRR